MWDLHRVVLELQYNCLELLNKGIKKIKDVQYFLVHQWERGVLHSYFSVGKSVLFDPLYRGKSVHLFFFFHKGNELHQTMKS